MLRVGKSFGPIVHSCQNSILAGCQLSCSFARGMLWELLDRTSRVYPEYPCAEHIDDLSHVMVAETESDLKATLLSAGRLVGSEVKRLKLKLSDRLTDVL